jgi:DNA-binding SARP family transcriptional activator
MEFGILGSLELRRDGEVVSVRSGKLAMLLVVLLLRRNQVVATDRLIEELWDGDAPATAVKTLQLYVSQLRKVLPAETLLTRPPGYVLRTSRDEVDSDRFEALLADGRRRLEAEQAEDAAETLREALALWRGSPLADFGYATFAQAEIARLEELRLEAIEGRFEADLARGRHADLVTEAQALLREHPLRERLRGLLMIALYRSGRQADALGVYREGRQLLDEQGIEPGRELRDVEQAILRQDESLAPPSGAVMRRAEVRPRRRRRALFAVVAAPVLVAGAIAAAYFVARDRHDAPARAPVNSVAIVDPASGRLRGSVTTGAGPASVATDASAVWVASPKSSTITRIDGRTHATSTIGGFPRGLDRIAAGGGRVWATERTAGLATVDVPTLTASPPVPLVAPSGARYSVEGIAHGAGALWVVAGDGDKLVLLRIDPTSERVVTRAEVGARSLHSIVAGRGAVWVSDLLENAVDEFDPKTLRRVHRVPVGAPTAVALGGGSLWVTGSADDGVWRFDARDGYRTRHLIPVGRNPVAIAYGEGAAWVALGDGTLVRIDGRTNLVRRTKIARVLNAVAVGDGGVWAVVGPVSFL